MDNKPVWAFAVPLWVGVIAGCVALYNGCQDRRAEAALDMAEAERDARRIEGTLITKAIQVDDEAQSQRNLCFLARAGLVPTASADWGIDCSVSYADPGRQRPDPARPPVIPPPSVEPPREPSAVRGVLAPAECLEGTVTTRVRRSTDSLQRVADEICSEALGTGRRVRIYREPPDGLVWWAVVEQGGDVTECQCDHRGPRR